MTARDLLSLAFLTVFITGMIGMGHVVSSAAQNRNSESAAIHSEIGSE